MQKSKNLTILALYLNEKRLHHTANWYVHNVMDGEFIAADIGGIESVEAVLLLQNVLSFFQKTMSHIFALKSKI